MWLTYIQMMYTCYSITKKLIKTCNAPCIWEFLFPKRGNDVMLWHNMPIISDATLCETLHYRCWRHLIVSQSWRRTNCGAEDTGCESRHQLHTIRARSTPLGYYMRCTLTGAIRKKMCARPALLPDREVHWWTSESILSILSSWKTLWMVSGCSRCAMLGSWYT